MAPSASAHMIMAKPVPYGSPNNSPLSPSGSDYPCKINGGSGSYDITTMNDFKVGENQTLSFTGTAVHGGGSCQLAVTLDKEPTKDSKFKVIHSIEGGCPGVGGPATFNFGVPQELPNGQATFAWTWFNKIGNREMYMNCAPITVSGGSDDSSAFDQLPDMALANIAVGTGASCKTAESSDYSFENPGASVERVGAGPFVPLCGGAASPGGGGGGSGAAPSGGASQAPNNGQYTPPAGTQAPAAPTQAPAVSSQAPGGGSDGAAVTSTVRTLITVTAPGGMPPATATAGVSSQAPVATPSPSAQLSQAPAPSAQPSAAPGAGAGGNTTCTTDGEILCNGETQFGICNHGSVVWQAVAAGTKCQGGKIARRGFVHRHQRKSF